MSFDGHFSNFVIIFAFFFSLSFDRRPTNLSIVWTRRSRRVASIPLPWEPDMVNPLVGHISWPVPDNHTISVTLFKDPRTHELEDKDWTFVIEDVSMMNTQHKIKCNAIMKQLAIQIHLKISQTEVNEIRFK